MNKCFFPERWLRIIAFLLLPQSVSCDPTITDAEKKRSVYEMYEGYKQDFPAVKDMTPQKAMNLFKDGKVLFVDVRKPDEIQVSMLPGAVTKEDFLKKPVEFRNKIVVAYCTIGYRSGRFSNEIMNKGVNIYNLKGGVLGWVFEGGKVYDANGETKRVHVYGKKWHYLPEGYKGVVFGFIDKYF